MREFVETRAKEFAGPEVHPDDWHFEALHQALSEAYPVSVTVEQLAEYRHHDELVEFLQEDISAAYEKRERLAGAEQMRELERLVTLRVVSARWIDHLATIEYLEEGIGLRGYSGVDPLVIYRKESYDYWQQLLATIRDDIVRYLFRVEIEPQETEEERRARIGLGQGPQGMPVEAEAQDGIGAAAGAATSTAGAGTALKAPPSREAPRRRAARSSGTSPVSAPAPWRRPRRPHDDPARLQP